MSNKIADCPTRPKMFAGILDKNLPLYPAAPETKIINQYLAQFSPVAPPEIAFESCIDKPVRVEASSIISPEDPRFGDLTNYWDDLHFHVA